MKKRKPINIDFSEYAGKHRLPTPKPHLAYLKSLVDRESWCMSEQKSVEIPSNTEVKVKFTKTGLFGFIKSLAP